MRPVLTPSVRRLWRDRETLQLGRPPGRAVVLAGIDAVARNVLSLLDGSRDHAAVLTAAQAAGTPRARTEQLLTLLEQAGMLDDADGRGRLTGLQRAERDRIAADVSALRVVTGPAAEQVLATRRDAHVRVCGAGRVGAAVAALLAAAGVGVVNVEDDEPARPEDCGVGGLPATAIGLVRAEAARALIAATGPPQRRAARDEQPTLVILTPAGGMPVPMPPPGLAHLVAEVRADVGVVGPLVFPGASACLRCLDLTRADRDPGWPALAVQLDLPQRTVAPCDSALAVAVAAQTALQALAFLDGARLPSTLGGTLELVLPDWRWRRRSWQLHPDCECGLRPTG